MQTADVATASKPRKAARVLVIHAHPAPHVSRVNRALLEAAATLPGLVVHDLYARYPDFFIDVRVEQRELQAHDVIVLQHPMYWYSVPALLKEWIDLVLEHGWAYGEGGKQLVGKIWTHAFSTGGPASSYTAEGINRHTIEAFLPPLAQTARLCGMNWQPPFISHAGRTQDQAGLDAQGERYRSWLTELCASFDGLSRRGPGGLP